MYKNPLQQQASQTYHRQKRRCEDPTNPAFKWYGAKGIRVLYSFQEFWSWYKVNLNGKNLTVGRIDHSKDYSLDNIEFQTKTANTEERNARCGNPSMAKRKQVLCFKASGMEFVKEYESTLAAEKATGVHNANIRMYCLGKLKQTKSGLTFRFKEVR